MAFTSRRAYARRNTKSAVELAAVEDPASAVYAAESRLKPESSYSAPSLKPALLSINDSCRYLGGISRPKFYADLLPLLDTVKIDNRHLVVVASLDALIAARRQRSSSGIAAYEECGPVAKGGNPKVRR
jgi:hypothetical protein